MTVTTRPPATMTITANTSVKITVARPPGITKHPFYHSANCPSLYHIESYKAVGTILGLGGGGKKQFAKLF